jgi:hypothetical protein
MAKKRPKLRKDVNEIAFGILNAITGDGPRPQPPGSGNAEAAKRGRAGGKKGGKARSETLTKRRRTSIAKKAAAERWKKPNNA